MKSFSLEIVTPDHVFYTGAAESLTLYTPSGKMGVLCSHEPFVAPLVPGEITVGIDGTERISVCTGGFLEVLGEQVYIFVQSIEWLEDIDAPRAREALERAKRHLKQAEKDNNIYEIRRHIWALERAEIRLRALKNKTESTAPEDKNGGGNET